MVVVGIAVFGSDQPIIVLAATCGVKTHAGSRMLAMEESCDVNVELVSVRLPPCVSVE
jgi:hypothetical protein